ncbi:hypothetical protein EHI_120260 [Entamoeba histolytica HM-1:IMSS]|uniref:Uncharacterized protein n=6 Tax=Entamoeba histolytica TaxID=5759 RepID=C4M8H6_ENTH1|nr:hypothetical protein EHI_120260 [Entamoeba histolytica HM-1:IMSS]EAL43126.2 hypothetical protein EHI_120260 [Entamoeba histolytica HM-1:IMSS]EMD42778.1 Hypothetical protein EHI5A_006380 [Entamoeba histolytica KU27]ENY60646.1 hypothetical protein EHI7A_024360 [Entamoeba histolytica HM-1:IMSS-A]|eukprot:XP_648512.2 hypothetical protein EHI_120260 [Entamoeba histolytica HM-1:IMSS]
MSIILLSHPKRRPELTRSIRDLVEALKDVPKGLNIKEIVMVKGCVKGCNFKEMDDAIEKIKKELPYIPVKIPTYNYKSIDGVNEEEWVQDSLSAVWADTTKREWEPTTYKKHMTVNFFFIEELKKVYNDKSTDYVLLAEDDQLYEKDTFKHILKLIQTRPDNQCYAKIAWCPYRWCSHYGQKRFTANTSKDFAWGAWGNLRSKEELGLFLRWLKFTRFFESEDTLGSFLCQALKRNIEVDNVSYHFGHDKTIPN